MTKLLNPYQQIHSKGNWYRGNLHAHTIKSDGHQTVQAVIDDYAKKNYDFLMISDHDIFMSAADYRKFDSRGMVLIPGNEVTRNGTHILHVNADRLLDPSCHRQEVLNEIQKTRGFAVIGHPNWQNKFDHCSITQLTEWTGYTGIEIYNGLIGRHDGSQYALDKWDMLLNQGRRIWGFAHDDSHRARGDIGLGWINVFSKKKNIKDILQAILAGSFYASTGVVINDILVKGNKIRIETENAQRIVALQQVGRRFAQADRNAIEVKVPGDARYVRFECWGAGESFAWTQPFIVES